MAITDRAQIVQRARSVWALHTVPYSQSDMHNGYRADCSGFVSAVFDLGTSLSTVTLPTMFHPIPWEQAQGGDIIGMLGPGTGGNSGHVAVIVGKSGDSVQVVEQGGGSGAGPTEGSYSKGQNGYQTYEFGGATGSGGSAGGSGGSLNPLDALMAPFKIFSDKKFLSRLIYLSFGVVLLVWALWKLNSVPKPVEQLVASGRRTVKAAVRETTRKVGG